MIGILEYLAADALDRRVHLDHTDRSPAPGRWATGCPPWPPGFPRWACGGAIATTPMISRTTGSTSMPSAFPGDAESILCGPITFVHTVRATLLEQGIPSGRIRTEQFGPTDWRDGTA